MMYAINVQKNVCTLMAYILLSIYVIIHLHPQSLLLVVLMPALSDKYLVRCRHQTFYSLLDRFRATVADSSSPSPPVTTHPLDGEPPPAPELVVADKVRGGW